jgi:hypothetical protein
MAGTPDLFVVCKNCRAEVSPYITECPYCGHRLRKRAPKLDKGAVPRREKQRRRPQTPSLPRMRPGEMPGVRTAGRPLATMAIVLASVITTLVALASASAASSLIWVVGFSDEWWKAITTTFVYPASTFGGTAYELVTLGTIFLFGWLLERRHGAWAPLLVYALGTAAGMGLVVAAPGSDIAMGGNAGALALLAAWVVRDLLALRRKEEIESDLLGVAAFAILMALMPVAVESADPLAGIGGAVVGLLLGLPLSRAGRR